MLPLRLFARHRYLLMLSVVFLVFYLIMNLASDPQKSISIYRYSVAERSDIERIDWNPYDLMSKEAQRTGLGEQGLPAKWKPSGKDAEKAEKLHQEYNYNAYLGDQISLERSIGDLRPETCKTKLYMKDMPEQSVSVIIPFYNEKNSTLLRSIHSIINRSPAKILKEIIAVDDFSSNEELGKPLDDYVKEHFSIVRILRNPKRLGLMNSRTVGADSSTGRFLVFLDSHVEVNYNYLPPLIELILLNYKTIACPTVDFIGPEDYRLMTLAEKRCRGSLDWAMAYHRLPVPGIEVMDETVPHPSPIMVGCAFAISRQWWEELGKYDRGLGVWGAEQYEISFKTWQCGGNMLDSPCSRVAHIFRNLPYVDEVNKELERNFHRVAAVWMDEYVDVVKKWRPSLEKVDPGDLTEQIALRKKLQCKSFKWFLENVAPDMLEWYPMVEPPPLAWGQVRSNHNSSLCLITEQPGLKVRLGDCSADKHVFEYTWRRHITEKMDKCFSAPGNNKRFELWQCIIIEVKPVQMFVWDRQTGHIVNAINNECLDYDTKRREAFSANCDSNRPTQSWTFDQYNTSRVDQYWRNYAQGLSNKNQPHG